jgi:hypothetical protein
MEIGTFSWKQKRDKLCKAIKAVSDQHGGDDLDWLKDYCREVIEAYQADLDGAIACFESLLLKRTLSVVG